MSKISPLTRIRAIVDSNGLMTEEVRVYFTELENRIPITGSGSPENFVAATEGATYYDLSAASGSRHYIKILNDIDGNKARGWELS